MHHCNCLAVVYRSQLLICSQLLILLHCYTPQQQTTLRAELLAATNKQSAAEAQFEQATGDAVLHSNRSLQLEMKIDEVQALLEDTEATLTARDHTVKELRHQLAAVTTAATTAAAVETNFNKMRKQMRTAMVKSAAATVANTALTAGVANVAAAVLKRRHIAQVRLLREELSQARTATTAATAGAATVVDLQGASELQLATLTESNCQEVIALQQQVRTLEATARIASRAIVVSGIPLYCYTATHMPLSVLRTPCMSYQILFAHIYCYISSMHSIVLRFCLLLYSLYVNCTYELTQYTNNTAYR
jgi:hypothetical protein